MNRNDDMMMSPRATKPLSPMKNSAKQQSTQLLEDFSVHLSLPSFHTKTRTGLSTWKCTACCGENVNALSNECSVCGMQRCTDDPSADPSSNPSETWHDDSSSNLSTHKESLHNSSNSLSLHNSFSIAEDGDARLQELARPTPVTPSTPSRQLHHSLPAIGNWANSSVSSFRSTRTARQAYSHQPSNSLRDDVEDYHASVVSFSDWNANQKVEANWTCSACTYVNENPLHLQCEVCGHFRSRPGAQTDTSTNYISSDEGSSGDDDLQFLQREQMRELIQVQREMLAEFQPSRQAARGSFDTRDMQQELGTIVSPRATMSRTGARVSTPNRRRPTSSGQRRLPTTPSRSPRRTVTPNRARRSLITSPITPNSAAASGLSAAAVGMTSPNPRNLPMLLMSPLGTPGNRLSDHSETSDDEDNVNLDELLQCTHSMLQEFKANKPAAVAKAASPQAGSVPTNESCLQYSMQQAGGKLHYNDLCLPMLWGDTAWAAMSSDGQHPLKAGGGKVATGKSAR